MSTTTNPQPLTTFSYISSMVPIFEGEAYEFWSIQMKTLYISQDLWDLVENGYKIPRHAPNWSPGTTTRKGSIMKIGRRTQRHCHTCNKG